MSTVTEGASASLPQDEFRGPWTARFRCFSWSMVGLTFVYLANNVMNVWFEWPGVPAILEKDTGGLAYLQVAFYAAAIATCIVYVLRTPHRTLRVDAGSMAGLANYIVRAAFWAVVFIGLADAFISFLRVEGMLEGLVGEQLTKDIGRSRFRGPFIHVPLIVLGILIAIRSKTLGFQWLALLVVVAELFIVISRFVFSYEQAFQGDLVRFWYGALFLFASAYTLFEDGHVRVDVLYAGFANKTKGFVNAIGSILLGMSLCWTILVFGMWDKSSIINTAILNFEVSQSGFGMYVKYWMAGFLTIFAVSMAVQFSSYLLESIADCREEPGRRESVVTGAH